jgi:hypothetical protein
MHAPARDGLPPVEANLPLHTRENFSLMRQASLDLAQRTAVLADKTRFLLIAEAWLKLADRVARKSADGKRRLPVESNVPPSILRSPAS